MSPCRDLRGRLKGEGEDTEVLQALTLCKEIGRGGGKAEGTRYSSLKGGVRRKEGEEGGRWGEVGGGERYKSVAGAHPCKERGRG